MIPLPVVVISSSISVVPFFLRFWMKLFTSLVILSMPPSKSVLYSNDFMLLTFMFSPFFFCYFWPDQMTPCGPMISEMPALIIIRLQIGQGSHSAISCSCGFPSSTAISYPLRYRTAPIALSRDTDNNAFCSACTAGQSL